MSERRTHQGLIDRQFGSRADTYLRSAVHAAGSDLDALAALIDPAREACVLDLGCGAGHVSFGVAQRAKKVVAYDLSPDMLAVVTRAAAERNVDNIETRQGVAEHLPFPDAAFDYVLTRYSAHHWFDLDAGLREVARVLRPDGIAGIADSISPGRPLLDTFLQTVELLRDPSHVRSYSRAEWEAALARAGLRSEKTNLYKVRLEFATWVERMQTPQVQVDAIRALQAKVSESVVHHFQIAEDGAFMLDVGLFQAAKPAF